MTRHSRQIFNRLGTAVLATMLPVSAYALEGGQWLNQLGPNGLNCLETRWDQANITYPGEWGTAYIFVKDGGTIYEAGNLSYRFGAQTNFGAGGAVTAAALQTACGYIGVTNVVQESVDGTSFAAETGFSLSWRAQETATGSVFEYTRGFTGATGTTLINTRTVHIAETVAPVITPPADINTAAVTTPTYQTLDVTSLGSVSDNESTGLSITYRVGATVLSGAYNFPVGTTTVTMDAVDDVGNNAVQQQFDVTITGNPAPTAVVGALSSGAGGTYVSTITLSAAATDFTDADLSVVNGSAVLTGSGTSYTATITPAAEGNVSLTVLANSFSNSGGTFNTAASNTESILHDLAPSVTISGMPAQFSGTGAFNLTVTFSEDVTGFDASDVVVTNASVGAVTGGPAVYTVAVTPNGQGNVTASIPAGAAQDSGLNLSTASNSLTSTSTIVDDTEQLIAKAAYGQASQLIASQPGLTKLLTGAGRGGLDASVTKNAGSFDLKSDPGKSVWAELKGSWSTVENSEQQYVFGAIGSHVKLNDDLLVGAMIQFDRSETTEGSASLKSTGWLVGPYMVAKAPTQPLYFEASALFGRGENEISPLGTYTDRYDSERWLLNLGVTGEIKKQGFSLYPSVKLSHSSVSTDGYIDGLGNAIQSGKVGVTEGSFGIDAVIPQPSASGELDLLVGVSGILAQTTGSGAAATVGSGADQNRARIDLGFNLVNGANTLRFEVFHDGIAASDYENTGVEIQFSRSF